MKYIKKRPILLFMALLFLGMMVAACGGGEEEAPPAEESTTTEEVVVEPTDEPEPTEEPEPTPEPEPTDIPAPVFDLSNDLESAEGGYAVSYPADWASSDLFGLGVIAESEELLDTPEPGADGAIALFVSGPTDEFGEEDDPTVLLEEVANEAVGTEDEFEIVEGPTAVSVNGKEGATLTYTANTEEGGPITGFFLLLMDEEHAVIMIASSPQDDAEANLPVFEAISETLTLMAPVVTEAETTGPSGLPESSGFLLYGDEVTGSIPANESTSWDFLGLAGEVIDITVTPVDDVDVVVDVVDESGVSILENGEVDDSFDTEEIIGVEIPESATYYIVVRGFAEGAGDYTLSVVESGGTAVSESGGGSVSGGSLNHGDIVSGAIDESGAPSEWTLAALDGDVVGIVVTTYDEFDAVIDVLDESGSSILDNTRDASFNTENLLIEFPGDGLYTIQVAGYDNGDGTFSTGSFDMEVGYPLTNLVFAADALEEDDVDEGHAFPITVFEAGEMIGMIVEPAEGLDVAIEVTKDDVLVELPGFDSERGFDSSVGTENFVFIVPEEGTYVLRVKNSEDDIEGNTGDYDVQIATSSDAVVELATGDSVAAQVNAEGFVEYVINVLADDIITFAVEPFTEASDMVIELEDLDGNPLVEAMDSALAGEIESLTHTFTEDALVVIRVREYSASPDAVFVLNVILE